MEEQITRREVIKVAAATGLGLACLDQGEAANAEPLLLIRDGDPEWYLSPDIWVVPGSDPSAAPGSPRAGQPAFLWAHIANTGNRVTNGVQIDFYWANPTLEVSRSNAHRIGAAFADIPPDSSQDVLCLVPWNPVIVNDGHECLVAVATHPADPLPSPLPDAFDPPSFRQVAQKNLTVLGGGRIASVRTITVWASRRADKDVVVTAEIGKPLDKTTLTRMGLTDYLPARERVVDVGLSLDDGFPAGDEALGPPRLNLFVPRGTSRAVYVRIRAPMLQPRQYQVVQITERIQERVLGGLGFVVVPESEVHQ